MARGMLESMTSAHMEKGEIAAEECKKIDRK